MANGAACSLTRGSVVDVCPVVPVGVGVVPVAVAVVPVAVVPVAGVPVAVVPVAVVPVAVVPVAVVPVAVVPVDRGMCTTSCSISGENSGFASYAAFAARSGPAMTRATQSTCICSAIARPASTAACTSAVSPLILMHAPYRSFSSTCNSVTSAALVIASSATIDGDQPLIST